MDPSVDQSKNTPLSQAKKIMTSADTKSEPMRPADAIRLELSKLRIEDGVSLQSIFRNTTERAAEFLGVERVGVWLFIDEGKLLRCVDLYERSAKSHTSGATLVVEDFPEYFEALGRRKTLPAEVAYRDLRTQRLWEAYLEPLEIVSLLDAPILVGGEVVGVVCHEQVGNAREWSTEERDFAGSMADNLALKIRAAEVQDARIALRMKIEQLDEPRRLASLTEMAAGIAHDVNNIFFVVSAAAQLIANAPEDRNQSAELSKQIIEAVKGGYKLAEELTAFARPGRQLSRVLRPAEVLEAIVPRLQTAVGENCLITLEIKARSARVLIAAQHLERIVSNLVFNARDAMAAAGSIEITLEAVTAADAEDVMKRFALITVTDQGIGIPTRNLQKIFDPFFSTKPRGQGTGLGLAIVQQIVSHTGGFIRVESTVGKGSSFKVFLPTVGRDR